MNAWNEGRKNETANSSATHARSSSDIERKWSEASAKGVDTDDDLGPESELDRGHDSTGLVDELDSVPCIFGSCTLEKWVFFELLKFHSEEDSKGEEHPSHQKPHKPPNKLSDADYFLRVFVHFVALHGAHALQFLHFLI